MNQHQWEERLVHYQYIQELLVDRNILEIGSGNGSGADFLAQLARRVLVLDTSAQRVARCRQFCDWSNVDCMVGEPDRLQVKDESFDVVVVPELERWFTRGGLLPEIRRVLAPHGVVLFVVRSADREGAGGSGMGYADLDEYLGQTFEHVRMLGAIPFRGMTMADFQPEGELDPQLDCSLVTEDEGPVSYLALCSRQQLPTVGYSVIQVPAGADVAAPRGLSERVLGTVESWAESEGAGAQVKLMTQLLDREMTRVAALEQRLEQTRAHGEELSGRCIEERGHTEVERVRAEAFQRQLADCQQTLEELRKRAEGAERRCDSLMIRIEQGAAELSTLHHRMAELQGLRQADQWHIDELVGKLRKLQQGQDGDLVVGPDVTRELERSRAEITRLQQELEQRPATPDDATKVQEAEARVVAAEQRSGATEEQARKAEKRAARAEQQVRELQRQAEQQQQEKAELEKELMRFESRLIEANRRATNSESKNVQMEVRLKRSESEASTLSKWAEELRDELKALQGKSPAVPPTPEPEVAALRNELREARERVTQLEDRCQTMLVEVEQSRAVLAEKEQKLQQALAAVDRELMEEVLELRRQNAEVPQVQAQLKRARQELEQTESQLRDSEQAQTELQRTRQELADLRQRVKDIDGASEELERLRLQAARHRDTQRELEQAREELERARIELMRFQDELRGGGGSLSEEAGWTGWEEEEEEQQEHTGYVGPDMPRSEEEDDDEEWDLAERVQVQERQIEALLEGAAMHRAEMERQIAQVSEMDALIHELQGEHRDLDQKLVRCTEARGLDQQVVRQLKDENTRLGRDLARVQGELRRCQEDQVHRPAAPDLSSSPAMVADLDREIRTRQKLQEDLERRLAEVDELGRELRSRDQALDRLRSEDTEHRAELRELRRQEREVERELQLCRQQLGEGERRMDQLKGEAAPLAEPAPTEGAVAMEQEQKQAQIGRLQQQLRATEEQVQCLNQDLHQCRSTLTALERKLEQTLRQIGDREVELAENKERIEELERQLEQSQVEQSQR